MDFMSLLGLIWPENNFWANLIKFFDVGSYVWTILIFTVILKLLISPLDFLQRHFVNKNSRAQALIKPELDKIKKQCGNNQLLLQKKQNELYSKYNFSMKGSCIIMVLYMAITLAVFITLFSSLQGISNFKMNNQFVQLQETYNTTYNAEFSDYLTTIGANVEEYNSKETSEDKDNYLAECYKGANGGSKEEAKAANNAKIQEIIADSQVGVVEKYEETKDSWLWVKNIWRSDKPTQSAILSYNEFKASVKDTSVTEVEYNNVMGKLLNDKTINTANGYYILSVIVVLVSLLSQYLSRKMSGQKMEGGASKILMFILPVAMLLFTINSSAMFSVYIITNSLISALLTPITTIISNKIENKKEKERKDKNKAIYSR